MLEAKNLSKTYRVHGVTVHALSHVTFDVQPGKTLAVVGESGCGKTTLAKLVVGIEKPDSGTLTLDGKVQMVFQNPYASLNPRKTIGAMLDEPLKLNTSLNKQQRYEKALEKLAAVGLKEAHYHRYPHMFSGGQRQRIAIARSLMLEPGLVVLDEPVSALDISIQAQVLNMLRDIQEATQVAYLFITHDLSVTRFIADDVLVMYLGRVMEYGAKEDIFTTPRHPYTQALLAARPIPDPKAPKLQSLKGEVPSPLDLPSGCVFRTRCPHANERCAAEVPALISKSGDLVACHAVEEGRI